MLIVAVIIGMTAAALGQNYYAYTEEGNAVNLTVQDSIITAKIVDGLGFWTGVYARETALESSVPPQPISDGFVLMRVKSGNDPIALVNRLRNDPDVLFANLSFLDTHSNPIYLTETLVANFHSSTSQAQIDSMNQAHHLVVVDSLFNDPFWLVLKLTAASDLDVLAMGNHYHESPLVHYAKAGMMLNLQFYSNPNDEYWLKQWHFKNTGQPFGKPDADIDLDEARDYAISPFDSITVAVTDCGFAPHEDFAANRFAWGWDYYDKKPDYSPGKFSGHGMGTMGIIAASTDNTTGLASVVGNHVKIIGQKIADYTEDRFAADVEIARAFSDAVLAEARVISNSWGCPDCGVYYPKTTYWIRKADSAGVVVVFAAGNDPASEYLGVVSWPANMPEVIAVGATDRWDQRWYYSMYGPELDVVAPSSDCFIGWGDIWTLDQMDTLGYNPAYMTCNPNDIDYDCTFGGTSAACPEVAGIIALVMLRRPDLIGQTAAIRSLIRASAEDQVGDMYDTPGRDDHYGWGRVNAAHAMLAVSRGDVNNSGSINISDIIYLINYIFHGGLPPQPQVMVGDCNCTGTINISDYVYLIAYIFQGGPPPPICFEGL